MISSQEDNWFHTANMSSSAHYWLLPITTYSLLEVLWLYWSLVTLTVHIHRDIGNKWVATLIHLVYLSCMTGILYSHICYSIPLSSNGKTGHVKSSAVNHGSACEHLSWSHVTLQSLRGGLHMKAEESDFPYRDDFWCHGNSNFQIRWLKIAMFCISTTATCRALTNQYQWMNQWMLVERLTLFMNSHYLPAPPWIRKHLLVRVRTSDNSCLTNGRSSVCTFLGK